VTPAHRADSFQILQSSPFGPANLFWIEIKRLQAVKQKLGSLRTLVRELAEFACRDAGIFCHASDLLIAAAS
jgi:hypothetical protein